MEYRDFEQSIIKQLRESFSQSNPGTEVNTVEVIKNNQVKLQGISVKFPDNNLAPVVYLDASWEAYQNGWPFKDILKKISESLKLPSPDISIEKELIKFHPENIFFNIVGTKQNQDLLKTIPHCLKEDLAITYKLQIEKTITGTLSGQIDYRMLKSFNITQEELHARAMENTPKLFPAKFISMAEAIPFYPVPDFMYVLTNTNNFNGASAMFYPNMKEKIRNQLGDNFYALPSSVHEMIVIPAKIAESMGNIHELAGMVREINQTDVVEPEDVLADSAYRVDDQGFTKLEEPKREHSQFNEKILEPIQSFDQEMEQEILEDEIEP